jgi:hypothetical protein
LKFLREGTEDEMVAVFLKAELNSPRHRKLILDSTKSQNASLSIIKNPDLKNKLENNQRAKVLTDYRGWQNRTKMFERVPPTTKWEWWELNKTDVLNLRYVDYSYWNELSKSTHFVKNGVETIKSGIKIFDVSNQSFYDLAQEIDKGFKLQPLIVYKFDANGPMEIIEGHVRATSIGLASKKKITVKAIIGKNRGEF